MARAFSQFSKSKQVNRVFVSKFAKSIAWPYWLSNT
jgi:hypothetical protein